MLQAPLLALAFPAVYWAMVLAKIRQVRRAGGAPPLLSPERAEEKPLRVGWHLVIAGWFLQPALLLWWPDPAFPFRPAGLPGAAAAAGVLLGLAGLALTRWCHRAMGAHWRMWIEPSRSGPLVEAGPYRWIRHPIYTSQSAILLGTWLLVPSPFLAAVFALHVLCIRRKSEGEERHLLETHGEAYRAYRSRTGRFFPKFLRPS